MSPRLPVAGLRVEREPDEVAGVGDAAGTAGYHDSRPRGPPQSVAPCRFLAVIRPTRSSRE